MIKNLSNIESLLNLAEGTLASAIASEEETSIDIPELVIRTVADNQTFVDNLKSEFKTAGKEIAIKEARNTLNLEFEGKTMENLLEAHKGKILTEAKAELGEPDKKIGELRSDIENLQNSLKSSDDKYLALQGTIGQERNERSIESQILGSIPDGTIIPKEAVLTLFKAQHNMELSDGKLQFMDNGEVMKNDLREPIALTDVMGKFITPYAKPVNGGTGEGDAAGSAKGGSLDAFRAEMEKKGVNSGSQEFNETLNKRISDGTLKL